MGVEGQFSILSGPVEPAKRGIFSGKPYTMAADEGRSEAKKRYPKLVPSVETTLKIKLFHSAHFETAEYNSIWSRKCGRDRESQQGRNIGSHVEADESAPDPWPSRGAGASHNLYTERASHDDE
jgi:hypothetical protein